MLDGVPSVVAVAPGFYCRQVCYGVLVIGGVSWGLCQILRHVCPAREPVSHRTIVGNLRRMDAGPAAHA